MTIEYRLTPEQLREALDNTIRVFDEYSLSKKPDQKCHPIIIDKSWNGSFVYFISETTQGSRLSLEAKASKSISVEALTAHEEVFLKNLFKIITKEIEITPEIPSISLFKKQRIRIDFVN